MDYEDDSLPFTAATITQTLCTAAEIAKNRLEQYLAQKLKDEWDETAWEFYTYLLEQAQNHKLDHSGYACLEYTADHKQAMENYQKTYSK
jgi:hypothetical protein